MQPFAVLQLLQSLFAPSQPQNEESAPPLFSEPTAQPPVENGRENLPQNTATSEAQPQNTPPKTDERDAVLRFLERHERRAGRLKQ